MKTKLLDIFICPNCKNELKLKIDKIEVEEVIEGELICKNFHSYPIIKSIPRFVSSDKYVDSFSYEWEVFADTLLDSRREEKFSANFFQNHLISPLEGLRDKLILDVGCGMGHFMEIAALQGGETVGIDLSYAVDVAYKLIGHLQNIHIIQADILELPFKRETFDFIYSFGVLHHTPDCRKAFHTLPHYLKKGGEISICVYAYNFGIVLSSKFWRFFTTRLSKKALYYFSYIAFPLYYLYLIPVIGKFFRAIFFVPDIKNWKRRHLEMFDWYSPHYQSNQSASDVSGWFREMGIEVLKIFNDAASEYGIKTVRE